MEPNKRLLNLSHIYSILLNNRNKITDKFKYKVSSAPLPCTLAAAQMCVATTWSVPSTPIPSKLIQPAPASLPLASCPALLQSDPEQPLMPKTQQPWELLTALLSSNNLPPLLHTPSSCQQQLQLLQHTAHPSPHIIVLLGTFCHC